MKWISILTGLLTLTVALFSFIVSFVSLRDISSEFGFPIPVLFPLTIEAGVIIFSINAFYRYLNQQRTIWQWGLVILSSGLALSFNVLHAQSNLVSQIMFGIPSLFFLLSFENFLSQISHITKKRLENQQAIKMVDSLLMLKQKELKSLEDNFKQTQIDFNTLLEETNKTKEQSQSTLETSQNQLNLISNNIEKSKVELQNLKAELKETKKQLETSQTELKENSNRIDVVLDSIKNGSLRINDLASEFEVSTQTIYNDVKRLEKEGLISKNGKGWKVK